MVSPELLGRQAKGCQVEQGGDPAVQRGRLDRSRMLIAKCRDFSYMTMSYVIYDAPLTLHGWPVK